MNSISTNLKFFIENDINPFILFDNNGKILYLNSSSEVLLGYVSRQELYDIALSYAPKDFGFRTTRLELKYDTFLFYAFTISYANENEIGLHLYYKPRMELNGSLEMDKYHITDINILLEANISLFKLQNDCRLSLFVDKDIPLFKIDQNQFSKMLRKTLESFILSDSVSISLTLKIGEYIIVNNKKAHIIELKIDGNIRDKNLDKNIRKVAQSNHISTIFKKNAIHLDIPFIT